MATTKEQISEWFDEGLRDRHPKDYMLIVHDNYSHEDYPVFSTTADFAANYAYYNGPNMQKIMEVYRLGWNKLFQLREPRAFNYPDGFKP